MARSVSGVIISRVPSGMSPRRPSPNRPTDLGGSWAPDGPQVPTQSASEPAMNPMPRSRPDRWPCMNSLLPNELALADREIVSLDQFPLGDQGLFTVLVEDLLAQVGR